jgi:hypothetical protein
MILAAAGRQVGTGQALVLPAVCAMGTLPADRGSVPFQLVINVFSEEGIDHYAVAMEDPEGNEFDIS